MGQTCFMSVILQSLLHNPLIRTFYLSEGHRKEDCEREACTSCALDEIFQDFYAFEKHEGYGAVHMLQGCWKGGGGLAGYSQQDAHEFLGFILNSLHAANTELDNSNKDAEDDGGDSTDTVPSKTERQKSGGVEEQDCPCAIHRTFGGQLRSTVTCTSCHNTTTSLDPFMDLSLDIRSPNLSTLAPAKKKKLLPTANGTATPKERDTQSHSQSNTMDLTSALTRFTATEMLSSDSYYCVQCKGERAAKKKLSLSRLPPVIPIHLKRFEHSKSKGESWKIEGKVRFSLGLDLGPYATGPATSAGGEKKKQPRKQSEDDHDDDKDDPDRDDAGKKRPAEDEDLDTSSTPPLYTLSSVIVHKGKMDNGHYICYCRGIDDEWFRFDDSMVVQAEEREVLGAEAYMLFYVREGV